jgi:hypothetical protein
VACGRRAIGPGSLERIALDRPSVIRSKGLESGALDVLLVFQARKLPQKPFAVGDVQSVQSFEMRKKLYGIMGIRTVLAELRHDFALSSEALSTLGDVPLGLF